MTSRALSFRRRGIAALLGASVVLLGACGSSSSTSGSGASATTSTTAAYSTGSVTSAPTTNARVPSSCNAIPSALITRYTGPFTVIRPFIAQAGGVSCDFENPGASSIVVVSMAPTTAQAFALLRAATNGGDRKVIPVPGLGASAFAISKDGTVREVEALTANGLVISIIAGVPVAKTVALIRELIKLT